MFKHLQEKEAAAISRQIARVKHHHKNTIKEEVILKKTLRLKIELNELE